MSVDVAKRAIDYYSEHALDEETLVVIFHGGGEPMTNARVVREAVAHAEMVATATGRGLFLRISTNGIYSAALAHFIAEHFDHVSLSLDGPPEIHNRQRPTPGGKWSYEIVVRSLRIFQQAGVLGIVNTVITPASVNQMDDIVRHMAELGIKKLRLHPMASAGRCAQGGKEALDSSLYLRNLTRVRRLARELGVEIVSFCEHLDAHTDHYCGACGLNFTVSWDGSITSCHEALNPTDPAAREFR
jgi:uncharacterized protein